MMKYCPQILNTDTKMTGQIPRLYQQSDKQISRGTMDEQANRTENPAPYMLLRASLRQHSPEQIYDYILKHIGELGMKIKKRQAIIGFENQDYYDKLIREYKVINLHGRRLEFHPITKAQENLLDSEDEHITEASKPAPNGKSAPAYPEFECLNDVEVKINSCRLAMLDKVERLFEPTIQATRERVQQIKLQFKEAGVRKRELLSLQNALEKKLKAVQVKYESEISKIIKFIEEFSLKPNNIELQPSFNFDEITPFPRLNLSNLSFHPAAFFANADQFQYECKRLCAINGEQFAVSMSNPSKPSAKGLVKVYDINKPDPKETLKFNPGAYGLCRTNNFIMVGSYESNISYVNMASDDRMPEETSKLSNKANTSFFDLKVFKQSVQNPEILAINTDYFIRKYSLSFEEVIEGTYSVDFNNTWEYFAGQDCVTFEIIYSNVLAFGADKKVKKLHMEKKIEKQISVNQKPKKILKFTNNLLAVASTKRVQLVDLRTECVVQTFNYLPNENRALEKIGEHTLMYGGDREIGVLDDRRHDIIHWKSVEHHKKIVTDILKLNNTVVSCDKGGLIFGWKLDKGVPETTVSSPIDIQ